MSGVTIVATEPATAHPVSMHGQSTASFIGEADPATEARAEDAVFLNQIRDVACRSSAHQPATAITKSGTAVTSTTAGVYLTR